MCACVQNEIMVIGRKQAHMDMYDNWGAAIQNNYVAIATHV